MFIYGQTAADAIAVMSYLAAHPSVRAGSAEIAAARGISQALTAKLLTQLSSAGWVSGQPGPGGGYVLARPPREISLMDIASLFEQTAPPRDMSLRPQLVRQRRSLPVARHDLEDDRRQHPVHEADPACDLFPENPDRNPASDAAPHGPGLETARETQGDAMSVAIRIARLYISSGHNFFGHHGMPSGSHPMIEVDAIRCVAGRGIEGDRFFDFKPDYKGQVTFFAGEIYDALCRELGVSGKSPAVFRRNVITRGMDLDSLIGEEFAIQEVRFLGVESCKPCGWMDQAFHPGAERAMRGRGGLRAQILSTGLVRR